MKTTHQPDGYLELARASLANEQLSSYVAERLAREPRRPLDKMRVAAPVRGSAALAAWMRESRIPAEILRHQKPEKMIRTLQRGEERRAEKKAQAEASSERYKRFNRACRGHGGIFSGHIARTLCLECRVVNAHAAGCSRSESQSVTLPVGARVPSRNASKNRWRQFGEAMAQLGSRRLKQAFHK